jgi:hypothetical protein
MIRFNVKQESINFKVESAVTVGASGESYDGSYVVIPEVKEQQMKTKNKYMTDDVTIEAIPYAEVSNTSDGITVTIG